MTDDAAKESRPARPGMYGKRDTPLKTSVDAETRELADRKARLLGYETTAAWLCELVTTNVRGVETVANLHADRVRRVAIIGPVLDEES